MKNFLVLALAALVINLLCVTSAPANPRADKDDQFAARVKASIFKLGTGPAARVEIKLRDGTKLKGYVAAAAEDHFVIVEEETGATRVVPYPQVKQIKGNNLSTGVTIAIAVVFVVGLLALVGFATRGK